MLPAMLRPFGSPVARLSCAVAVFTLGASSAGCHGNVVLDHEPGGTLDGGGGNDSDAGCTPEPTGPAYPHGSVAVNLGVSIALYPTGATSGTVPFGTIAGCATRLDTPFSSVIGFDAQGRLAAARDALGKGGTTHILVYETGAIGNALPVADLNGPATGLDDGTLGALAFDAAGSLYVSQVTTPQNPGGRVLVFPPGADGNIPPTRTIAGDATSLRSPVALAFDVQGSLYVVDVELASVAVFSVDASGDQPPLRIIGAPGATQTGLTSPEGVVVDTDGTTYVSDTGANGAGAIRVFAAGANGDVSPQRVIVGDETGLGTPSNIGLDPLGRLFVLNASGSVVLFPTSAEGNVPGVELAASGAENLAIFR